MKVYYQKYDKCDHKGKSSILCNRTAKEFHKWLKKEGFIITKAENKKEIVLPHTIKIF